MVTISRICVPQYLKKKDRGKKDKKWSKGTQGEATGAKFSGTASKVASPERMAGALLAGCGDCCTPARLGMSARAEAFTCLELWRPAQLGPPPHPLGAAGLKMLKNHRFF